MDTSIIIIKILGIYFMVSGLFILFRGKTLPILLKDLFAHRAHTHAAGVLLVVLGGLMALRYNTWENSPETWIMVLGWLVLAKGVMYIFFPEQLAAISRKLVRSGSPILGAAVLVIGAWLFAVVS